MFVDPATQYSQHQWVPPMSYPQWSPQQPHIQPWQQGWRGPAYGNVTFQPTTFPTYPQYPSNISQLLLGFNPPALPPPPQLHQQLTLPINTNLQQHQLTLPMNPNMQQQIQDAPIPNPPWPTPIHAQPIPNPNNRPTQPARTQS